jgi:hypothetical protein
LLIQNRRGVPRRFAAVPVQDSRKARRKRLGRKLINHTIEAAKWRTYRAEMRAAKAGCLCKRISVRDGSHFAVPKGFDPKGPSLRWIGLK